MYALMSASELSSDPIWLLRFGESAQHQYCMSAPAEAGLFFFFFSPCFGSDRRRKHKHSRHKQKFHLFPFCVEKETGLTGGEARTRDGANENLGNGGDTGNTLWVMWLARRALLCFAGRPCIKPAVIFFNTRLLRLTATVTGKQLDRRGGKRTPMNEVVSMAYLMEGDSCSSTSPLTTN